VRLEKRFPATNPGLLPDFFGQKDESLSMGIVPTMADGTSLKTALAINGIKLSKSEVRSCYRNRTLQALYQEARRKFLAEHYGRKPTLRAKIRRYM
jgi:hypothetical protein